MNWAQFKKLGLGMRVQLEPPTCFLDDQGRPLPPANDDWIVLSFPEPEVVEIHNPTASITAKLGKDHIYDYRSNPSRSTGELKYGFLVLKMQLFVQGVKLWMRPNGGPGQPVHPGVPVDIDAIQRELARLKVAIAPRRLTQWQKDTIAAGLRGKTFEVWIGTVGHDGEARGLWQDIVDAVKAAGLPVVAHTSWELAQGVSYTPNGGTAEDRAALKAAFAAAKIELWDANGEGARRQRLEIIVGSKAPVT